MNIDINKISHSSLELERILHFLPYPFLVSDLRDGARRNIFVNRRFTEEIGYTCADIPTIDDWFVVAYPDLHYRQHIMESWQDLASAALEKGRDHVIMKAKIHTRNNGFMWYEVKASLSTQNHLVTFVNIDELVRQEQQLRMQDENKNKTLSILSHDLRSPLANLLAISEIATNIADTTKLPDILASINTKTRQVLELLDTTLTWTRNNFESIHVKVDRFSLREMVGSTLSLYAEAITEKNFTVTTFGTDPMFVMTDRDIVNIIVRNIVSNAIKFTRPGGTISIDILRRGGATILTISDTGVGMARELIDRIHAGSAMESRLGTRNEKGLGIGLKFCVELAEKIGAGFQIESSPGGTTVQLIIPDRTG